MLDLANDPRTLNISTGATFRQKGDAFYTQLRRRYVPQWMYQCLQNQAVYGQGFMYAGMAQAPPGEYMGYQQGLNSLMGRLGGGLGWN